MNDRRSSINDRTTFPPPTTRPGAGTRSLSGETSGSSGAGGEGGGNETDVEDGGEDGSGSAEPTSEEVDLSRRRRRGDEGGSSSRAMYPFPPGPPMENNPRRRRAGSSAVVELSTATSDSSEGEEDDGEGGAEDDVSMASVGQRHRVRTKKRVRVDSASPRRAGRAPPAKLRRVGALGISVHSDSDPEAPNISGLNSNDFKKSDSSDTRATSLGIRTSMLRASSSSGGGGAALRSKSRKPVTDSTFRSVVDELVVQNHELQSRLKRYEAEGVSDGLKQDRLFEIRFGPALPAAKRVELERYLASYVQEISRQKDEKDDTEACDPSPSYFPPQSPHPTSSSPRTRRPAPLVSRALAGPSNSGWEAPSFSGTGFGMLIPTSRHAPLSTPDATPASSIDSTADQATARTVVAALELLFYHSLLRIPSTPPSSTPSSPVSADPPSTSNETYFSRLLSHDFLGPAQDPSGSWVYLNLACTMAQVHRFSVTLSFVQQAVKQFSTRLAVSEDGGMIRWVGSRSRVGLMEEMGEQEEHEKPQEPPTEGAEGQSMTTRGVEARRKSSGGSGGGSLRRLLNPAGRDPSSGTTGTSGSQDSIFRDPSSGENSLYPSTAATSQPPSRGNHPSDASLAGRKVETTAPTQPVRPLPSVVQPMGRLRTVSEIAERTQERKAAGEEDDVVLSSPSSHPSDATDGTPHTLSRFLRHRDLSHSHAALTPALASRCNDGGRAGAIVFYANSRFCSDLSKEVEPALMAKLSGLPTPAEEEDACMVLGGRMSSSVSSEPEQQQEQDGVSADLMSVDSAAASFEVDGGSAPSGDLEESSTGRVSSLGPLRTSGMTTTVPSDLFTLVVRSRYPLRPTLSSTAFDDDFSSAHTIPLKSSSIRAILPPPQHLSTKTVFHTAEPTKRDHFEVAFLSSSGSGRSCSEDGDKQAEQRKEELGKMQHLLTSSNLAKLSASTKHVPPAPQLLPISQTLLLPPSPSPPMVDYALSLALPSHPWAPTKPQHRPSAPASVAESLGLSNLGKLEGGGGSATGWTLSTGDERPLSLSESVGPSIPLRRR